MSRLLAEYRGGDPNALAQLMPLVYDELRRIAAYCLRAERHDHTLQPTALANEAYMRLVGTDDARWEDRAHFFAVAARVIRHILVDHARARKAGRRGGDHVRVEVEDALLRADERSLDLAALDDALRALEAFDPRKARLVELRYFGGLSVEEAARELDISPRTVKREWQVARAWLRREILHGSE